MKKLILIVLIAIPAVGSAQLFKKKEIQKEIDTVFVDHDYLRTDLSVAELTEWVKNIPNNYNSAGVDYFRLTDRRIKVPGISGISAINYEFYYYNGKFDLLEITYHDMFDEEKYLLKEGFKKVTDSEYVCNSPCNHKLTLSHATIKVTVDN